jgi:hypothetical protein
MAEDSLVYRSAFAEGPCDKRQLRERRAGRQLASEAYAEFLNGRSRNRWKTNRRAPYSARVIASRSPRARNSPSVFTRTLNRVPGGANSGGRAAGGVSFTWHFLTLSLAGATLP